MTHYAQGTRFECKVRDDLAENGYSVIRAAGSKGDAKIDLIALKPGQLLLVQCKRTGSIGPDEWDRVFEVAGWVGAVPLLAANGPLGRGVTYLQLLGPKRRRLQLRHQPCRTFHLDHIAASGPPRAPQGDEDASAGVAEAGERREDLRAFRVPSVPATGGADHG